MKVTCSQQDLLNALNIVNKAVNSNNTLPVLNNILIKTEEQTLHFSATNLELAITCHINAQVTKPGSITIPARLISSYVALLGDKDVTLNVNDNLELNIESASSNTKIKGISPDEFPLIPQVETEQELELSVKDLLKSINATCFAAAVNTSRPALSGVLFNVQESEFLLVGTDSFRLAEFRIALPAAPAFQGQYIVPARTVSELAKIMEKANDSSVKIKFSDNQILFEIGNALVISRLIDGKFPEYSQIIPKERKTRVECEVGSLSLAMRRASLFSRENNHSMRFEIKSDGKMLLHTDETRVGEENAEIEVAFEGEENMISLNAQYMLDVLNIFGEKKLSIDLIDKDAPALIRESGNQSYIYLIMPLKTNS